jgi:hypothetical protein
MEQNRSMELVVRQRHPTPPIQALGIDNWRKDDWTEFRTLRHALLSQAVLFAPTLVADLQNLENRQAEMKHCKCDQVGDFHIRRR